MVHLFVVHGYQGSEEDADKLLFTDKLLRAVLAEAQVVCVWQPFLVVGDLNADPGIINCLAKGIASGRFCDLALAFSPGAGKEPDATCRFKLDDCAGTRRDFIVACPDALAASSACWVTDRWFLKHFSVVAEFSIRRWTAGVSCPIVTQLVWPACWIDTPDRSSSSSSKAVQDIWDIFREDLGVVPPDLISALRDAFDRNQC